MKYMVMECHLSYAVVLDEEGHFLKVANRQYEVGQSVTEIFEMKTPEPVISKKANRWVYPFAAMAACLGLVILSMFQIGQMTYASVYMTINPEIRIDVNRKDIVVGLEGLNPDGNDLVANYKHRNKELDLVMDELVDRAIEMGYLYEGGQISLVLDADSDEWIVAHGDTLTTHLNEYLSEKIVVTIEVTDKNEQSNQVIIPVTPVESEEVSDYGESDYGVEEASDYGESDYGVEEASNYGESDYGDEEASDYGESAYEIEEVSDYGESDYEEESDYEDD